MKYLKDSLAVPWGTADPRRREGGRDVGDGGRGGDECLWRGCLAGRNRGTGQDQIDIAYAIRSGDECGTQSGPWAVCYS